MTNQMILASVIFIATYCLIISGKISDMVAAFLGAILMLLLGMTNQELAIEAIDFNTIGLLIGMMIIVNITKRTGVFQYIAILLAKKARGSSWMIMVFLGIFTAMASAILDNVTTVLLVVPVTLAITETLEITPIPFLMLEILLSNIGGTASLIGDPPNIMIGSSNNLGFMDFILNLGPIVIIIFVVTMILYYFLYGKKLKVDPKLAEKILSFDEKKAISDKKLLFKSLLILFLTISGFTVHQFLQLEAATIAISGAMILLLISGIEPQAILQEIEWSTIFFFAGLFILVSALEHLGIIELIAKWVLNCTKGDVAMTALMILWVSAFASSFINNIPYVATMIPMIQALGRLTDMNITPIWWALALGACLGGNGTLVGASANVIVAGIAEKDNNRIGFFNYMKLGMPMMIISMILSSIYIYLRYLD